MHRPMHSIKTRLLPPTPSREAKAPAEKKRQARIRDYRTDQDRWIGDLSQSTAREISHPNTTASHELSARCEAPRDYFQCDLERQAERPKTARSYDRRACTQSQLWRITDGGVSTVPVRRLRTRREDAKFQMIPGPAVRRMIHATGVTNAAIRFQRSGNFA